MLAIVCGLWWAMCAAAQIQRHLLTQIQQKSIRGISQ